MTAGVGADKNRSRVGEHVIIHARFCTDPRDLNQDIRNPLFIRIEDSIVVRIVPDISSDRSRLDFAEIVLRRNRATKRNVDVADDIGFPGSIIGDRADFRASHQAGGGTDAQKTSGLCFNQPIFAGLQI